MSEIYNHLYEDLEDKLRMIDLEEDNILKKSEQSFQIALRAINQLRDNLQQKPLVSQNDEISFFKEIKPKFVSKLIYHLSVFNIETNKPNGGIKVRRKYYQNELDKLKRYFDNNLEFYRYYRTHSNYLDHKYLSVASKIYGLHWIPSFLKPTLTFLPATISRFLTFSQMICSMSIWKMSWTSWAWQI